ncbi:MAG: FecR domain-containing protein [Terriglobales bacterium]
MAVKLVRIAAVITLVVASLSAQTNVGAITAKLGEVHVVRRDTEGERQLEGAKGVPVLKGDLIRTERGGRMRINLLDGSIISAGSQTEFRLLRHDPRKGDTTIVLTAGRMHAVVARGVKFVVRTPVASVEIQGDCGIDEATVSCTTGQAIISKPDGTSQTCAAGATVVLR